MSDLENLSEEQLVRIINAKKMGAEEPDYSQQYKRNFGDTLRDFGYGGLHGLMEGGKFLGNIATGGHVEDIPGWNKLIPWEEKMIESVKSPYPSPAGRAAQIAGEFAIPEAEGVRLGYKALRGAASKLPAITKKGMGKLYTAADKTAIEEGVSGLQHPPKLLSESETFLQNQNIPVGERIQQAMAGDYKAARDLKNIFGKLSRRLPYGSGESVGAENLHADWTKSFLKSLEEGGFSKTHEANKLADVEYAKSQSLRKILQAAAKYGTGLEAFRAILGMTKHI